MGHKEFLEKTEEFAKKIVKIAAKDRLTVVELCQAADTAKAIAYRSMVDNESIKRANYPSQHLAEPCGEKELFGD